jgi:signal transduction histidine kinase
MPAIQRNNCHAFDRRVLNLEQPTVLIVSDDAEFSRAITGRWQAERNVPAFTSMSGDLCQGLDADEFDLAIVGTAPATALVQVLTALESAGKPVVFVCAAQHSAQSMREAQSHAMVLHQREGWLDALVLVASETLRRCNAVTRCHDLEAQNALLQHQATLGVYMLEMRHSLNNALTSVLGNSELMLLEPGTFSASIRSQLETIRNMGLRMHEVLQRFSSLEKELKVTETQEHQESGMKAQSAAAAR